MSFGSDIAVYVVLFIGAFLIVEGVYLTVFQKQILASQKMNRRMQMLKDGDKRDEVIKEIRREMDQHRMAADIPLYSLIAEKAFKAAIPFSPLQLVGIMGGVSIFSFLMILLTTSTHPVAAFVLSLSVGIGGVYVWLSQKAAARLKKFEEQLPDAVELIVRSLRVGYPFATAVRAVASDSQDPLASELGLVADAAAYGRDITEALHELADRLDLQDIRFMAVAVSIQQTSGGNLADVLDGLAKVIRGRFRLFRKINAITSEAKWSGKFLSAFPLLAIAALNYFYPEHFDPVRDHPLVMPAGLMVVGFVVANLFVMRSLVNIKV